MALAETLSWTLISMIDRWGDPASGWLKAVPDASGENHQADAVPIGYDFPNSAQLVHSHLGLVGAATNSSRLFTC